MSSFDIASRAQELLAAAEVDEAEHDAEQHRSSPGSRRRSEWEGEFSSRLASFQHNKERRLRQLQEELETVENRDLTFQPQINEYEFKSHRSDFLSEVEQAEEERKRRMEETRKLASADPEATFRPNILPYSKSLANSRAEPVHERLYSIGKDRNRKGKRGEQQEGEADATALRDASSPGPSGTAGHARPGSKGQGSRRSRAGSASQTSPSSRSVSNQLYQEAEMRRRKQEAVRAAMEEEQRRQREAPKLSATSVAMARKKLERGIHAVFTQLDSSQTGLLHAGDVEQALYSLGIHERLDEEAADQNGAVAAGGGRDASNSLYPAVAAVNLASPPPRGAVSAEGSRGTSVAGADRLIAGLTDAQRVSKEVRRQYRLLARAKHQREEQHRLWRIMAGPASTLDYAGFVLFMLRTLDPQGTLSLRAVDVVRAHGALFPHLASTTAESDEPTEAASGVALREAPSPAGEASSSAADGGVSAHGGQEQGQEHAEDGGQHTAAGERAGDVRVLDVDEVEAELSPGPSRAPDTEQSPGPRHQGPHPHPHRHQIAREFARVSMDRLAAPVLHATSARRQNYRKTHVSGRIGADGEGGEARVHSEAARALGLWSEGRATTPVKEAPGSGEGERGRRRHRRDSGGARATSTSPQSQRRWHRDAAGNVVLTDSGTRGEGRLHSPEMRRKDSFVVSSAALRAGNIAEGEEGEEEEEGGGANTASASRRARARFARLRHAVHGGSLVGLIRRTGEARGDGDVAASVDARTGRVLDSSALALSYQVREADGCTFQPRINEASRRMASKRRVRTEATGKGRASSVHDELLAKHRAAEQELERLRKSAEEAELERCTFSPKLTSLPPYLQRRVARMKETQLGVGGGDGVDGSDRAPATPTQAPGQGRSPHAGSAGSGGNKRSPYGQSPPAGVFDKLYQASKARLSAGSESSPSGAHGRRPKSSLELELEQHCTFRPARHQQPHEGGSGGGEPSPGAKSPAKGEGPGRTGAHNAVKPKGYLEHAMRLRRAHEKRREKEMEKKQLGKSTPQSYARAQRRLEQGPRPFALNTEKRQQQHGKRQPRLYMDVHLGLGKGGRIALHEYDDPAVVAANFARIYTLDAAMRQRLVGLIEQNMRSVGIPMADEDSQRPLDE